MISIKKFLSADNEAERAHMHVVRILIQGMGEYAVGGEADDCDRFREHVRKILDALNVEVTPEELLVQAGSVLNALEDHNHRVTRQHVLHSTELQNMLKMLTLTLGAVSEASNANISRLGEIDKRVTSASELDDVRMIKTRLSDCLSDIRNEVERQRKDSRATIEQLSQGLDEARQRSVDAIDKPAHDAATGFPLRPAAEVALASASQAGTSAYAAVIVLDRLQAVNLKFGRTVGDEVLGEFARMVGKKLSRGDQLFRWTGPVLVAIVSRPSTIDSVRSEIAHILGAKVEHTVKTGSRSILIPIAARWAVFPMVAAPRLIYQRIDTFAAALARD